jgi:RNA polymerase sigma-70 factor (ECF subfamily)
MVVEGEWVQRVLRGDPGAESGFIRLFKPRLLRASVAFLAGQAAEAEDMVQDTFLVALPRLGQRPPGEPLFPWLRQVCLSLCCARRRCRSGVLLCLEDDLQAYMRSMGVETVSSSNATVQKQQKLALLREMIKRLEPESRQMIQLRNVHGMSYAQIGQVLGLPPAGVSAQLSAARGRLHRSMESLQAA